MGDEDKKDEKQPEAGAEGAEGGKDEGNESKAAEGAEGGSDGGEESGDVLDKHGKPGINAEKYKRDMEAKDAEIEKLQAQIAEAAKTEEGKAELQKQIDELKASQADERVNHKLEMAGCVNTKAAKALLDDYDGDVVKLKNECPYLFESEKKSGSTGGKPAGAAKGAIDEKIDKAFGLKN